MLTSAIGVWGLQLGVVAGAQGEAARVGLAQQAHALGALDLAYEAVLVLQAIDRVRRRRRRVLHTRLDARGDKRERLGGQRLAHAHGEGGRVLDAPGALNPTTRRDGR